ncbi:MAG: hypothetical protein E7564_01660 [Ruminococcaceae bacterium]|nr:hypothetical protein [Oscillospiraceae bacterium]
MSQSLSENNFRLVISSPNGNTFDGEAYMLRVRGIEGELAILAKHIPFVTVVKECEVKVELPDGEEKLGYTKGGILAVSNERVTLFSGSFKFTD